TKTVVKLRSIRKGINPQTQKEGVAIEDGSGVIVSADGKVLTDLHVVRGWPITKLLVNGQSYEMASVLATDESTDTALIQIKPNVPGETFPYAELGSASDYKVGTKIYVVGFDGNSVGRMISPGKIAGTTTPNAVHAEYLEGEDRTREIIVTEQTRHTV